MSNCNWNCCLITCYGCLGWLWLDKSSSSRAPSWLSTGLERASEVQHTPTPTTIYMYSHSCNYPSAHPSVHRPTHQHINSATDQSTHPITHQLGLIHPHI